MKHYEVTAKFGGPTNRVSFSSTKNPEISHKLIMEDSLFARELNMTRRFIANRSVKAVYRETYPGSLITYWIDPIVGAQKFTEYVISTFRCDVTVELGLRLSKNSRKSLQILDWIQVNEQFVKCVKFQENASETEILMFLETTRWTKDVIKAVE
ncbi:hypothetical protein B9Z55_011678 [Caenorhabditis nigoni]|uniref:Uncharacterized protein n=1 Tax=Caenorhabditis nigoni TaxID=1611254 RepID=A0A2G5UL84_9PELO|nr:hypothetical protein B9Z55_011678 [Caenorhabditis nigoni]